MEFEHDAPAEGSPDPSGTTRRSLVLKAAFGVGALTIGGQVLPIERLVPAAGAQDAKVDDAALAGFNQRLMLAAVNLYKRAADSKKVMGPDQALLTKFEAHYSEWATALKAIGGSEATNRPNAVLSQTAGGQIDAAADEKGVLGVLFDTENSLAATLTSALGSMTSVNNRKQIAPILPVMGQHAAMLGLALEMDPTNKQMLPPFQSKDGALDMKKYSEES